MTLSVLIPTPMADVMLLSSSVAEADAPAWTVEATFALAANCISPVTHRIYESAKASNVGKDPTDIANRAGSTIWWLDKAATNRWRMFDLNTTLPTVGASPMTYVIKPGAINAMYFDCLDADQLVISVKDKTGGAVVFTKTIVLEGSQPSDYYEYFFEPFKPLRKVLIKGIDSYTACEVTITLTRAVGPISVGVCCFGDLRSFGDTLFGAKVTPNSSGSYIKLNDAQQNEVKLRKAGNGLDLQAAIKNEDVNYVLDTLMQIGSSTALWVGSDQAPFDGLMSFGIGRASASYDTPTTSTLSLNVEGLTK